MFTFGILSSHLPYVAFAAFYLFYLFFPTQFKQLNEEPVNVGEEKIISLQVSEPGNQKSQSENFQFQTVAEEPEAQVAIIPEYYILTQISVLNNNQGPGIRFYSPLFSRPPPTI